jgi:hypothetical protein
VRARGICLGFVCNVVDESRFISSDACMVTDVLRCQLLDPAAGKLPVLAQPHFS